MAENQNLAGRRPAGLTDVAFAENIAKSQPEDDNIRKLREQLFTNGYKPVPVQTGKKIPSGVAWADRARRGKPVHPTNPAAANTGILGDGLRILDVDIDDTDKAAELERLALELLGSGPTRIRDNSPRRAVVYRAETGAPPKRRIVGEFGALEVLGAGQQLVVYGRHPSGAEFAWRNGSPVETPLSELPAVSEDAISEFLRQAEAIIGAEPKHPITAQIEAAQAMAPDAREDDRDRKWALTALAGVASDLASAGKGGRNGALNRAAHRLGTIAARGWLSETEIRAALEDACQGNGLAAEDGITAVRKTIASGLRAGLAAEPHPGPQDRPRNEPDLSAVAEFIAEYAQGTKAQPNPSTTAIVQWHGRSQAIQARRELVKGLLPSAEVALIAGQSGAGKTFIAIELATCLASGNDFFGHRIRERGGTLFLLGEGAGTISERLEAVRLGKFPDDEEAHKWPIAWKALDGSLLNEEIQKQVFALAQATAREMEESHGVPLRLIIVDTIAAAFAMADENDAAQATAAMKVLQKLHAATRALVAGVAHYGKTAATGVRGSSAFTASADAILAVNADRDEVTGRVLGRSVALTKSRWRDTGWTAAFDLDGIHIGHDEDGEDIWSAFVRPGGSITEILMAQPRGPRLSKGIQFLLDTLNVALGDHGEARRPYGADGPEVVAVSKEALRVAFYERHPADGETEAQRAEAKRKAFNRALRDGQNANVIGFQDADHGGAWVWRT